MNKRVIAPKNIELEAFVDILDKMHKDGVVLVGFKGINFETDAEVLIPSQTFAHLIVSGTIEKESFLGLMGKPEERFDQTDMKVTFVEKKTSFGSTDS